MAPPTTEQLQNQLALDFATNVLLAFMLALVVVMIVGFLLADRDRHAAPARHASPNQPDFAHLLLLAVFNGLVVVCWLTDRLGGPRDGYNPYSAKTWASA